MHTGTIQKTASGQSRYFFFKSSVHTVKIHYFIFIVVAKFPEQSWSR